MSDTKISDLESVVQTLREARHEGMPKMNNPKIRLSVLEGDTVIKEVVNGGHHVHPAPPPNSEIIERSGKDMEVEELR